MRDIITYTPTVSVLEEEEDLFPSGSLADDDLFPTFNPPTPKKKEKKSNEEEKVKQ